MITFNMMNLVVAVLFLVTLKSSSALNYQDDLIVGGINGPVNFTRPEGIRRFFFYVPSTYTINNPLPLIIYFHGYGGNWTQGVLFNQTNDAEVNGYVLGLVEGTPSAELPHVLGWNGGTCCLFNTTILVDDVTYARTVVQLIRERVAILIDRIYAMGWSNGGYMTERIGCEASDLFAGVAPDASGVVIGHGYEDGLASCDASFNGSHINYLHFHGLDDKTVPWVGGHDDRERLPSALENLSRWVTRNGCDNVQMQTYNVGNFTNIRWPNCRSNTFVEFMTVSFAGHIWWTLDRDGFSTADYIMKAFTRAYLHRQQTKFGNISRNSN